MMRKGSEREKTIDRDVYQSQLYLNRKQWDTYLAQINYIRNFEKVSTVLEIGCGGGVVSSVLCALGYDVSTLDINENLLPTYIGDISKDSFQLNEKFDLVLCAEVLEHIPFENFSLCLKNINVLSREYAVITLPNCHIPNRLEISINSHTWDFFIGKRSFDIQKEHFWEINCNRVITNDYVREYIMNYFDIIQEGIERVNPYHYYYLLKKKDFRES